MRKSSVARGPVSRKAVSGRKLKTISVDQSINPLPPPVRDVILDAANALEVFESADVDVEAASRIGHEVLMDLWSTNPLDPLDGDNDMEDTLVSDGDFELAGVRRKVLAAVDCLRIFRPQKNGDCDGLRLKAITAADRFLAIAPA